MKCGAVPERTQEGKLKSYHIIHQEHKGLFTFVARVMVGLLSKRGGIVITSSHVVSLCHAKFVHDSSHCSSS